MIEARITADGAVDRRALGVLIAERLHAAEAQATAQWHDGHAIRSVVVDDLLPASLADAIGASFPPLDAMTAKATLRERKHIAAQMNRYSPLVEEAVFAFQEPEVVAAVARITGLEAVEPDRDLYAGGISAMARGAYLRPHLDNSHDARRQRYRVLNLLFYVTPDWDEACGGSLQLWDDGPRGAPRTIASRFNRLVLMATDRRSWHSVNEVKGAGVRRCVSNYYFSECSPEAQPYFHATSYRAEHGAGLSDFVLRADGRLRTAVLKATGDALFRNPHRYERDPAAKG